MVFTPTQWRLSVGNIGVDLSARLGGIVWGLGDEVPKKRSMHTYVYIYRPMSAFADLYYVVRLLLIDVL